VGRGAGRERPPHGLNPQLSGERSEDEGLFVRQHAYWREAMQAALETERRTAGQMLEAAE